MSRKALALGLILVAGVVGLASIGARAHARPARQRVGQPPIPGFPADPAALMAINHPDVAADRVAMRAHAWHLFQYLTTVGSQPRKDPLWRAWSRKCDVDLSPLCPAGTAAAGQAALEESPQIEATSGNPEERFSTVYYNPVAASFIKSQRLNDGQHLQELIRTGYANSANTTPSIPDFPPGAIVIKEIWEGFPLVESSETIQAYDPDLSSQLQPDGSLAQLVQWPTMPIKNNQGVIDAVTHCSRENYQATDPVPVSCFYNRPYPIKCTPLVVRNSPLQGIAPTRSIPCILVLVGVQIITHEIENWTWNTFWWTDKPKSSALVDDYAGMPVDLPDQYSHYVMRTTFGPAVIPPGAPAPKPVFNPYLEGPQPRGASTSCFGCHAQARYSPICDFGAGCGQHNTGDHINGNVAGDPPGPCQLSGVHLPDSASCEIKTGFLWSLSTSQDNYTIAPMIFRPRGVIPFRPEATLSPSIHEATPHTSH